MSSEFVIYDRQKNATDIRYSESGMALLLSVLIASLLMGVMAGTALFVSHQSVQNAALISESNQARTTALEGIYAYTYDMHKYGTQGGNGEVAAHFPTGTTESAHLTHTNPYFNATLSGRVVASTFSADNTAENPGYMIIKTTGSSGNASYTATALITGVPTGTPSTNSQPGITAAANLGGTTYIDHSFSLTHGTGGLSATGFISLEKPPSGFNEIVSTHSIILNNSPSNGQNICSQKNIEINDSGTFGNLQAMGQICANDNITANSIQANGDFGYNNVQYCQSSSNDGGVNGIVTLGNGGTVSGSIISGDHSSDTSGGVYIKQTSTIGSITTTGNIRTDNNGSIGTLYANGNFSANNNPTVGSGKIGGKNYTGISSIKHKQGYQVSITPVTTNECSATVHEVNAYPLAQDANFAFYPPNTFPPDTNLGFSSSQSSDVVADVVVKNMGGIPHGHYYLYNPQDTSGGPSDTSGYICTSPNGYSANNTCYNIATGYNSNQHSVIKYESGKWEIQGGNSADSNVHLVPGVMWFYTGSGEIVIQDGTFYNSFITTGNIHVKDSGSYVIESPNYAGAQDVCGFKNEQGDALYPENFCTSGPYTSSSASSYNFTAPSIGNLALYAGGYPEGRTGASNNPYTGGNIHLAGEGTVGGDVVAGNYLSTNDTQKFNGYIQSNAENHSDTQDEENNENYFNDQVTIDLGGLPKSFNPTVQKASSYSAGSPGNTTSTGTKITVSNIFW